MHWPVPAVLDARPDPPEGRRPEAVRGRRRDRDREPRRPAPPPPAHLPRPRRPDGDRRPEAGGGGDGRGQGADRRQAAADPPPRAARSSRPRSATRRARRRRSGSTAPGSPTGCSRGRGCCCAASSSSTASPSPSTSSSAATGDGDSAGLHTTGLVPVHPASERLRPQRLREWAWQAVTRRPPRGRAAPGLGPRRARDAVGARRPRRLALPRRRARGAGRPPPPRLRGAAPLPGLARDPARAAPRGRGPRGRWTRRASWSRRWLESLPFELTGDQRAAIDEVDADLGGQAPMQRLLMGEVGSGKTVRRPLRDAARRRGRRPGGADGADRDARRAALPHARVAARGRRPGPVRPADRRDPGGRAQGPPRSASPSASPASWSAPTP